MVEEGRGEQEELGGSEPGPEKAGGWWQQEIKDMQELGVLSGPMGSHRWWYRLSKC